MANLSERDRELAREALDSKGVGSIASVLAPVRYFALRERLARVLAQAREEGQREGMLEATRSLVKIEDMHARQRIELSVSTVEALQRRGYFLHDSEGEALTGPAFLSVMADVLKEILDA